jgi:hypothetical protein
MLPSGISLHWPARMFLMPALTPAQGHLVDDVRDHAAPLIAGFPDEPWAWAPR